MPISKHDLEPAKQAAKYLADTASFDANTVTAFVITPKLRREFVVEGSPVPVAIVQANDEPFAALKTAFGHYIADKRAQAQELLTKLDVTD